jgi:hypothetical protein
VDDRPHSLECASANRFRRVAASRAVSGNMTCRLWGPDGERGDVLIANGLPRALLERHYRMCGKVARIDTPLARPWGTDLPVYACRAPRATIAELWPEARRFGHVPAEVPAFGSGV